jgi:hypothetical protein
VEASIRMLQAAKLLSDAVGGNIDFTRDTGFDALPPFTASIERLTPLLTRLITEGVAINLTPRSITSTSTSRFTQILRPL